MTKMENLFIPVYDVILIGITFRKNVLEICPKGS